MTSVNNLSALIDAEGHALETRVSRVSPTSVKVSWKPPAEPLAYAGALVVASPVELNPSNFPTSGVRYEASSDWSAPADKLGLAQVVGAFYDDLTTSSVTITNTDANQALYISVHLATNVYGYYSQGIKGYPDNGLTVAFAGRIEDSYAPPTDPQPGQVYFDPVQGIVFSWTGTTWQAVTAHTTITGEYDPQPPFTGLPVGYPVVGSFFYNTTTKALKSWSGSAWIDSEPPKGEPTYQRQGIGTTGESTARENIKNILKAQLGWPVVCVELTEFQFEIAMNNALQELRRRTDSAYYKQFFFMMMFAHQQIYYLNDPTRGLDSIVDVVKIHRVNGLGLGQSGNNSLYVQQFLQQFYSPGVGFDLVSVHLMAQMQELYSQLFAGDVAFNWREATRELHTYRRFFRDEKVLIECSMEKPEQELLQDRWTQQWIQQWAEAELMFMLAHIRGKFASLPGPGGGLQLNADSLMSEGTRLQEDCLRQIRDFEVGQNGPDNWYSGIVMG